jgi:hypothetical protein
MARRFVALRVTSWQRRRQLTPDQVTEVRAALDADTGSEYLADFAVHMALKPFVKSIEYWLLPVLYAAGLLSGAATAAGMLTLGPIARTAYTAGRIVQATARRRPRPWLALMVGVFPVVGNFAFPLEILRSGSSEGRGDTVARFIVLDGASLAARAIPIWGGRDTLTEHRLNHAADRLARMASRATGSTEPG